MSDYTIECRKTLRGQLREIQDENGDYPGITVTCPCGRTLAMFRAFRCFHCGIWFCSECAKEHFGPDTSEHADPFKTGRTINSQENQTIPTASAVTTGITGAGGSPVEAS